MLTKVVSIALFGENHEKYARYLPAFVRGHLNVFPISEGWRLRVHIDPIVEVSWYGRSLFHLAMENLLDLVVLPRAPLTKAMLWRMAPVFEDGADYVFCRDLDAAVMPRDRAACETFIRSGCLVHTVHDNLAHAGIMGGLCGFKSRGFKNAMGWEKLDDLYAAAQTTDADYATHGTDQIALNRLICRKDGPLMLEHRYHGWAEGKPRVNPPRQAGTYLNKSYSTPTPDEGWPCFNVTVPYAIVSEADRLGNHLGCAGYDNRAAVEFWDLWGRPEITVQLAELRQ